MWAVGSEGLGAKDEEISVQQGETKKEGMGANEKKDKEEKERICIEKSHLSMFTLRKHWGAQQAPKAGMN